MVKCCSECDWADEEMKKNGTTFELGKWWPGGQSYTEWRKQKLSEFTQNHILLDIEPGSTNSGGIILWVRGYKK